MEYQFLVKAGVATLEPGFLQTSVSIIVVSMNGRETKPHDPFSGVEFKFNFLGDRDLTVTENEKQALDQARALMLALAEKPLSAAKRRPDGALDVLVEIQ